LGGLPPNRTLKFCPNNCLTNIFLDCEFQFSMLSSLKVSFLGKPFCEGFPLQKAPKFCPNNCLANNFLLCEFQLSMLSSSKVLRLGGPFWGVRFPPWKTLKFGQNNVSATISYIVSFNFLMSSHSK